MDGPVSRAFERRIGGDVEVVKGGAGHRCEMPRGRAGLTLSFPAIQKLSVDQVIVGARRGYCEAFFWASPRRPHLTVPKQRTSAK